MPVLLVSVVPLSVLEINEHKLHNELVVFVDLMLAVAEGVVLKVMVGLLLLFMFAHLFFNYHLIISTWNGSSSA